MDFSEIELRKNRAFSAVRLMKGCSGDMKFSINNMQCSYYRGEIEIDGTGSTRSCNHRARGNLHCLIVFSLEAKKPLLVVSHQIPCITFYMNSTVMMKE